MIEAEEALDDLRLKRRSGRSPTDILYVLPRPSLLFSSKSLCIRWKIGEPKYDNRRFRKNETG